MSPEPSASSTSRPGRSDRHAAVTLAGVMAAHAILETARDGLFLTHLPVEQLPRAYLAIAAITLLVNEPLRRLRRVVDARTTLMSALGLNVLGLICAYAALRDGAAISVHALYVGVGVGSSVVTLQFWIALGERVTLSEAKERYARIALGGSFGAFLGFAVAAVAAHLIRPESMILISSGILAATLLGSLQSGFACHGATAADRSAAPPSSSPPPPPSPSPSPEIDRQALRRVVRSRYARRLTALLMLATLGFAATDYLFKAAVAEHIEPARLTAWLATFYLGLNAAAALVLAVLVTPTLRRIGLQRALLALPIPLAIGGVVAAGGFVVLGVGLAKFAEGTLRHSFHRTTTELLFLPLPESDRPIAKILVEVVADKGARAAAALVILALAGAPEALTWIASLLAVVALAWVAAAVSLRRPYLDLFRRELDADALRLRLELPDLDTQSPEALLRALDHSDVRRVCAALRMLAERDAVERIPALILYHPSREIVERALELFARARRTDVGEHVDRLLGHEDAGVRAAATRMLGVVYPDRARLSTLAESDCPCIRVSAVNALAMHGWISADRAKHELEIAARDASPDARLALARSARVAPSTMLRDSLIVLAGDSDPRVRREVYAAMHASRDAHYLDTLVSSLGDAENRDRLLEAIGSHGDDALGALERFLLDASVPRRVRQAIASTVAEIGGDSAARLLIGALACETLLDGGLRHDVLRALGTLAARDRASLEPGRQVFEDVFEGSLDRALVLVEAQALLDAALAQEPRRKTRGATLLGKLLDDKERLAVERLFLLLDLLHPDEDFEGIWLGLTSARREARSSSLELLDNLLSAVRSRALSALVHPASAAERLKAAGRTIVPGPAPQAELFERLCGDRSRSLRAFADYWSAELAANGIEVAPSSEGSDADPGLDAAIAGLTALAGAAEKEDVADAAA